jgi:VWFA-related protein
MFIFLFDATNNDMQGLSMACRAAVRFIEEKLRPGDAAAVVSAAGIGGVDLVQNMTTDLAKVRTAIDRVRAVPGRRWLAEIEIIGGRPTRGKSPQEKEVAAENLINSPLRVYTKTMPLLARAFGLLKGTKNVLFFSAGISAFPAGGAAGRLLAAANMPVFAINSEIGKNSTAVIPAVNENAEEANPTGQRTLDQVARLSGGRPFGSMNALARFDHIADAIDATVRNYFIVGYSVRADWTNRYHQVKVEILKPGFTVHAPSGYYDSRVSAPAERRS